MGKLTISPQTKVGELLNAYPELEEVLIGLTPAFVALKNPVLKRTVGRVATLSQAAVVGGIKVEDLVNRLRKEAGQEPSAADTENDQYLSREAPEWFSRADITDSYDATQVINSGGSPMAEILHRAANLQEGEILEVKSPFVPAPVLDILKGKGFSSFSQQMEGKTYSFITKKKS